MTIRVSFDYEPDHPDDEETGMTEEEFNEVSFVLMDTFGAENIQAVDDEHQKVQRESSPTQPPLT